MRAIITNYQFIPASNQVVFSGYTSINQSNILLILDATQNVVLYNPTLSGYGGTVAGNVLTLAQNTSSYPSTDVLQIFYEDLTVSNDFFLGGFWERALKRLLNFSWVASASGASLNVNTTNTVSTSTVLAAGASGVGGVTLGTTLSQAGQSQLQSQMAYQASFRRNLTPI